MTTTKQILITILSIAVVFSMAYIASVKKAEAQQYPNEAKTIYITPSGGVKIESGNRTGSLGSTILQGSNRVGAGSNSFPTSLNNFNEGDILSEDVINSIEAKIGIDGSTTTSTLDYLLKNSNSVDPGHLHTSAGISGTFDFSDKTNATVSSPITLSDDDIGFDLGADLTWTGVQTFDSPTDHNATSTFSSTTTFESNALFSPGSAPSHQEGLVFYDSSDDSLSYYNNDSDVTMNIGREDWIRVRNETGSTINNGEVVRINGAHSGTDSPTVALAQADVESNAEIAGVATHDIENNSLGYITTGGLVRDLNTSSFSAGDKLWLSPSNAGEFTNTKPSSPNFAVSIGHVTQASAGNGTINVLLGEGRSAIYTSGSIPFATSSGALVEDNSNFFWDFGNSRLGLLTNSPSATFDINGNFQIDSSGNVNTGSWQATDVAISHGGTGTSTASGARSNLGLSIGSDVQAWDTHLDDIAGLTVDQGDLITGRTGGNWGRFDVVSGDDGNCLIASSTATAGFEFQSCPSGPGAGSPGGNNGEVQYNNGGSFGGMTNVVWDDTTNQLGVGTTTPSAMFTIATSSNERFVVTETGDITVNAGGNFVVDSKITNSSGNLVIDPSGNVRISDAYNLPIADGADGQVVKTDGAGSLSFENDAGANTFRDSNIFELYGHIYNTGSTTQVRGGFFDNFHDSTKDSVLTNLQIDTANKQLNFPGSTETSGVYESNKQDIGFNIKSADVWVDRSLTSTSSPNSTVSTSTTNTPTSFNVSTLDQGSTNSIDSASVAAIGGDVLQLRTSDLSTFERARASSTLFSSTTRVSQHSSGVNSASSNSIDYNSTNLGDRVILVFWTTNDGGDTSVDVSSIDYGTQTNAFTKIADVEDTDEEGELWYLANPTDTGTNNLTVTLTGTISDESSFAVNTYTGVDTNNPIQATSTTGFGTSNSTTTVASDSGDMVVAFDTDGGGTETGCTGFGFSGKDSDKGNTDELASCQTVASGANTTLGWEQDADDQIVFGVTLNSASPGTNSSNIILQSSVANSYDTNSTIEKVDATSTISVTTDGGADNFRGLTYDKTNYDLANDQAEDHYTFSTTTSGLLDMKLKVDMTRNDTALSPFVEFVKVMLGD